MQVWGNSFHFLWWLKFDFLIISSCLRRPLHSPFSDLPLPFWSPCSKRKVLYKPHSYHWWGNCTSALFFPFFSHPHFSFFYFIKGKKTHWNKSLNVQVAKLTLVMCMFQSHSLKSSHLLLPLSPKSVLHLCVSFTADGGDTCMPMWKSLSCVRLFVTPWPIQSMEVSRPEYQSG